MLHRNQLVPATSSDVQIDQSGRKQETGAMLRRYLENLKLQKKLQPPAPGLASHTTLERLARLTSDDITMEETRLIPQSETHNLPRILTYKEINSPLRLLYGAVIESIRTLDTIPDMLFIARSRLAELKAETKKVQQREYDDYFVYYSGYGKLEYIPVYPAETLPEAIGYAIGQTFNHDEVIAVCNIAPSPQHMTA